ncbi:hypothetical protein [Psychrobium sp. 1_MG-2023]|uniref:hypothetical protein n=1 Tax=Psychrobium sp. 1_MG-2023 TaxID=3062624 RepID=UPI000C34CA74|nr:hypothetical protein [Psychrobium sp. 1_MG-2023]MDP2562492.1 hypothetical protein [Psychrobium sp. 1_MG-2023]PKF54326.1 hypothetical protein CW748_16490 [Alteromonadales bacterium alter-6D02]
MFIQFLSVLETLLFTAGILLILTALFKYTKRTEDYQSVWRVFVNKLKHGFDIAEFKFYRAGVLVLVTALILRLVNQIFFPSYW